jgi:hypothetical protein
MSDAKQIIPPGWKLVPIAPTKEMVEAGETALDEAKDSSWDSGGDGESCHSYEYLIPGAQTNIYKAMLAAAPKPRRTTPHSQVSTVSSPWNGHCLRTEG